MPKKRKRVEKQAEWPFLEDTSPEDQLKSLRNYYEGRGPHINFRNSIIVKVANEAFRKAALRKVN